MRIDTYKCDVCGQMKGESNHWFRAVERETGIEVGAWGTMPQSSNSVDLCSDSCVIKTVQSWLTEQKASLRTVKAPAPVAMIR